MKRLWKRFLAFATAPTGRVSMVGCERPAQHPEIDAIKRLVIAPGDVLVVKAVDKTLSQNSMNRLSDEVEKYVPAGVKVMVIDKSIELAVLHAEEVALVEAELKRGRGRT